MDKIKLQAKPGGPEAFVEKEINLKDAGVGMKLAARLLILLSVSVGIISLLANVTTINKAVRENWPNQALRPEPKQEGGSTPKSHPPAEQVPTTKSQPDVQSSAAPLPNPQIDCPRNITLPVGQSHQVVDVVVGPLARVHRIDLAAEITGPSRLGGATVTVTGVGASRKLVLAVPAGVWGTFVTRLKATDLDDRDRTAVADITVTTPEPGFGLDRLEDRRATVGEPIPPVKLAVIDRSAVQTTVTFTALVTSGEVLSQSGIVVDLDRPGPVIRLVPRPGVVGSSTVAVTATAADGRTASQTFRLTVEPKPLSLTAGGRARIRVGTDELFRNPNGPAPKTGVGTLTAGDEVTVRQLGPQRCEVEWVYRQRRASAWVDLDKLEPLPD